MTVTAKKNVKKGNGFTKQNNNFAWASRFLLHFFAVTEHIGSITTRCSANEPALRESGGNRALTVHTTRTLHFLFLRFMKDVNTRRRFSLSFVFFFCHYLTIEWGGIIAMKLETARFHFLNDFFAPCRRCGGCMLISSLLLGYITDLLGTEFLTGINGIKLTGGWIHSKLWHCCDVILSPMRGQTKKKKKKKTGVSFFYSNKSSKKSNIASKNEQNTTKFMPFFKLAQCYRQ